VEFLARWRDERVVDEHAQAVRDRRVVPRVDRVRTLVMADPAEVAAKLAQRHSWPIGRERRHVLAHVVVDVEATLLVQARDRRGGEGFRDAPDPELRSRGDARVAPDVGEPAAFGPNELSCRGDRDRESGGGEGALHPRHERPDDLDLGAIRRCGDVVPAGAGLARSRRIAGAGVQRPADCA